MVVIIDERVSRRLQVANVFISFACDDLRVPTSDACCMSSDNELGVE